ncbi:hypothetical protein [Chitinophaga sancti]|uniref:Uncharacterized protein n=1 Tax=Chitinophaga sancti TaxID=1004 RepID=A0ABZ0XGA2_9BACT|nr:hypothetical protein [Chitinophaga sancti]WQD64719.1 hypothetical protein U0033_09960 [Chitinophaga sancti]WQG89659.1 hypothetical protein SR876_32515 [Chitinophaga sancti]
MRLDNTIPEKTRSTICINNLCVVIAFYNDVIQTREGIVTVVGISQEKDKSALRMRDKEAMAGYIVIHVERLYPEAFNVTGYPRNKNVGSVMHPNTLLFQGMRI